MLYCDISYTTFFIDNNIKFYGQTYIIFLTQNKKYYITIDISGSSAVWLAHLLWEQRVGGSNPLFPTIFQCV